MTGTTVSLLNILHPGLILIVSGLLVMVLPKAASKIIYVAGPVLALASLFVIRNSSIMYQIGADLKLQLINADKLGTIFAVAFCIVALIGSVYSLNEEATITRGVQLIYAGANLGVVLAGDLITLIVFWEISAFTGAYVVYAKHCRRSSKAAYRYLLVHCFGGGMLLAGGLSYINQFGNVIDNLGAVSGTATFWVIFVGVAINAAVPPINSWLPDAYPESTIGGTVFLGSYTTKAAIYLMIRFFAGTEWIVYLGCFMAIYGVLMAMLENDLRRLLSYHIISQLGYMVASLGAGGAWGIDGAAAHTFSNIMYKGTLLMCTGAVIYATGKRKISELGGMAKKMPLTAACFMVASLAIAGMPFLNGFASKALIMEAMKEGGFMPAFYLLTAASVGTWLSIALKINVFVFWGKADRNVEIVNQVPLNMKIGMVLGALSCIITGIFPNIVYNLTPYGTDGHPFTIEHILEYLILFIGGSIMFYVFRKRMEPHDEISLDFDWFYRRPLNSFASWLALVLTDVFGAVEKRRTAFCTYWREHLGNPYLWTKKSANEFIRKWSFDNEDKPIGECIAMLILVFAVVMVIMAICL